MEKAAEDHYNRPMNQIIADETPAWYYRKQRLSPEISESSGIAHSEPGYADSLEASEQFTDRLGAAVFSPILKHYDRNQNNFGLPPTEPDDEDAEWEKLPQKLSILHQYGDGAEQNKKWTSLDGHREAIYDGNRDLVPDPENAGTYNFYHPTQQPVRHSVFDVAPYVMFGNSPQDPTTMNDRIRQFKRLWERKP